MSLVKQYRLALKVPFSCMPTSDTFLGHIFWAIKYIKGEVTLLEIIDEYKTAKGYSDIPIIMSSIFPYGYLPKPILPLEFKDGSDYEDFKKIKQINFLNLKDLDSIRESLSFDSLHSIIKKHDVDKDFGLIETQRVHNLVDRATNAVGEDGLFVRGIEYYSNEEQRCDDMWFFVQVKESYVDLLEECLSYLQKRNIGPDSSVGMGECSFIEESNVLVNNNSYTHFITLSHCVSSNALYYKTRTKYGKIFMKVDEGDEPCKQPIIVLEPGSLIVNKEIDASESILCGLHTNDKIIHPLVPFMYGANFIDK